MVLIARRVLAVAVFAALALAPAASADVGVIRDKRGDAGAAWDITKITVDNGARTLQVRVDYRGPLRPRHNPQGFLADLRLDLGAPADSTYDGDYAIDMLRGSTNPRVRDRLHLVRASNYSRVRCRGLRLRANYRRGLLRFSVPQRCLGGLAGRVRVAGHSYAVKGSPRQADYLRSWSRWIARG